MLGKCGHFYEPIRTINHFGQSDFRVLCHFGFGFSSNPLYFITGCHYYDWLILIILYFFIIRTLEISIFRGPAELSPAELINKIIKIPKHIPDYDKSEFRSRQHVMTVPPTHFVSTYLAYTFLARSWVS